MSDFGSLLIFSVQDRTGTVAQLSPVSSPGPENPVEVGDTGVYAGTQSWSGAAVSLAFTVNQLVENSANGDFGITTALGPIRLDGEGSGPGSLLNSAWPESGTVAWTSGANEGLTLDIAAMTMANAYIYPDFLRQYVGARGNFIIPDSPAEAIQNSIVQATDYLNQRYRYKGTKLLQFLSNGALDPSIGFIDPWLGEMGFLGGGPGTNFNAWFTPSATQQALAWPRVGVVDNDGDSVFGVPLAIKYACAELAARALNGVVLQPDYDSSIVSNGGVVSSISQEVGPIKTTKSYNIPIGLGFFASFPQVDRIVRSAGLLIAGGGRSIIL
jgi:hypothetical protein